IEDSNFRRWSFLHAHLRVRLQGLPVRVRGADLRQTEGRVPEMPEQETGAATLRVRRVGEERGGFAAVAVGRILRIMRRSPRAGGLLAEGLRLVLVSTLFPQLFPR